MCVLITIDPDVSFYQSNYTVYEADGLVAVFLKRSPPSQSGLEINIKVSSKTASGKLLFKTTYVRM